MTSSANNVIVGKARTTGAVYVADITVTAPVDAASALDPAFTNLGLVNKDGATRSIEKTTETLEAWTGPYKTITTEHSVKYSTTLLESSYVVLCEVFGKKNVTQEGDLITVRHNDADLPARAWALEMASSENAVREFIPNGVITSAAPETTFNASTPVEFPIEIEALVDAFGNKAYSFTELGAFADEEEAA